MPLIIAKSEVQNNLEVLGFAANVISLDEKRQALEDMRVQAQIALIDELKYRKLINLAVTYKARLAALKTRELEDVARRWVLTVQGPAASINWGDITETFWRNKNLFMHRVLQNDCPIRTEIACALNTNTSLLITINEAERVARFDVVENGGLSGYSIQDLDYDLSLSGVFGLLREIEAA